MYRLCDIVLCVACSFFPSKPNEVFACFKDFYRAVQTQYGAIVKVLRSDTRTEYANIMFRAYLSYQGIQHQTTFPYTPEQNGVAETKKSSRGNKKHDDFYECPKAVVGTGNFDACLIDQ